MQESSCDSHISDIEDIFSFNNQAALLQLIFPVCGDLAQHLLHWFVVLRPINSVSYASLFLQRCAIM